MSPIAVPPSPPAAKARPCGYANNGLPTLVYVAEQGGTANDGDLIQLSLTGNPRQWVTSNLTQNVAPFSPAPPASSPPSALQPWANPGPGFNAHVIYAAPSADVIDFNALITSNWLYTDVMEYFINPPADEGSGQ